jgi:hypothetical protein
MRLALAYPDVFRGALLNSGSDRIGQSDVPLPRRDLFLEFQKASRLVYVTGSDDTLVLSRDNASISSMRDWCVSGISSQPNPGEGHSAVNTNIFRRAMQLLEEPVTPVPSALASCQAQHEQELGQLVKQAQSLAADGKNEEAKSLLKEIDARFGGLEPQEALDLDVRLGLDTDE